ncbi:putative MFS drug transporter [Aspergillus bombycis]|uniref:Efflux pump dotC n=1 Tax=Aspergillus bombycis TaxID=109264 RepID=A0A1F7ZX92_9EURO|nr:putative MFS drug transporter [Aspergillus bombycis]OGM43879.1 putative MFS drug transporter [Aspergillus bombycis]
MTALSNPIDDRDQQDTHPPSNGQIVTDDKIAPAELNPSLADTDTSNNHRQSSAEKHPDESNGDGTLEKVATGASLGRVPSQAQKLGKKKIVVVMAALCLVLFLAALDMTIISTALPTMASHFNASESGYSWMASSYMLANAAAVPLWGKISDIWGRKRILLLANFAFLVGSLICALAINLPMILVGRAIQGVGGGGIIVLVNICVSDLFSVRERPMYYGLFGSTWAIAGALGPIVGGAFTTNVTWRWCFYLNLPIGGVSFVILVLFLKIEAEKTPLLAGLKAIDWTGIVLIMGGTLMFLFGLDGVGYRMVVEWKVAKYPVIPIRLFTNWHNVLVLLVCFCHSFVFIAGSYYLPLYFQTVLLANPIMSGVYVLPNVLGLSFTSACTGFIIKKTGRYRELIVGGLFFMTLGYGLLIDLKYYASWPRIIIYQLIAGFGSGPVFQAPLVALQANIHRGDVAAGTSTFGFLRQTSAAMSIVLGTVVYQNVLHQQMPKISAAIGPEKATALASSFSGSQGDLIKALPEAQKNVVLKAYTFTLSRMWIFYTAIIGFGLLVSLLIRPVVLSKAHTFTKTGLAEQERARQEILAAQRGETQPESKETV